VLTADDLAVAKHAMVLLLEVVLRDFRCAFKPLELSHLRTSTLTLYLSRLKHLTDSSFTQHYCKAHSRFRGNTVMFIPITAVLPLYPLPCSSLTTRLSRHRNWLKCKLLYYYYFAIFCPGCTPHRRRLHGGDRPHGKKLWGDPPSRPSGPKGILLSVV